MSNTHLVVLFINHTTKQFIVTARLMTCKYMKGWPLLEQSRGFVALPLAIAVTDGQANQAKTNITSTLRFAGYEKVTRNRDEIHDWVTANTGYGQYVVPTNNPF